MRCSTSVTGSSRAAPLGERVGVGARGERDADQRLEVRPPAAGSTSAVKPMITPSRRSRRTRSAAALALRPTAAPRSLQEMRASSRSSLRISLSVASIAAIIAVFADHDLAFRGRETVRTTRMDPTAALSPDSIAGLAIAMQVGAVSLLLIEAAVVAGPRVGVAAGMGVATADFGFAAVAAAAGGAAGAALASHERRSRSSPRSSSPRSRCTASAAARASRAVPRRERRRGRHPRALRALPRDHGREPAHDRVVRGGRRRAVARRAGRGGRVRGGRRRRVGRLAPGAHARRRARGPLDHAGDPARPGDRRPAVVLAIAAHLALGA